MADQDFIDFRAGLDPSEVNAALKDIEKHAQKHFDKVAKQVDKIDSGMGKLNHQLRGAKKLWSPIVKGLTVEYKRLGQEIEENKTNLKAMIQVARTGSESEKAAAKSRIKELRQIRREKKAAHKEVGKTMGAAGSKAKQETTFDRGEIAKTFKEAGAELREPLDKLLNKDLPSAMGDATKLLGKGMSFWIGGAGGKLEGLGAKLGDKFKDRAMAAGAKGKKGSAMGLQAAGGAMKGLGGIGKLVKMFSSLGPILVGLSSVVVGLVKMFVDAEAQVKEFNKEVLSTAGTAQFLHRNMGDATSGAKALGNTLDQIRDAAFSLDNLDWGISSKDHAAVLQTLQSEGVSLDRMRKDMERTATATKDAAGYVNNWGDLTHMSVAYSRALGVSLAELTQLQGTFMSDIGMGLTSVTMGFQQMTRHAEDAGIASTKFFGIIRGISSDLSLYNTRLEDASKHLATLGKVMSPRNAEKFLQATMNSVKGMGRMEKLKLRVMGGGKQKQIMEEGIARKERQFAGDLGEKGASQAQVDAVLAAKDTTAAVMKLMDELGVDKEARGALVEEATRLKMVKTESKKGRLGQAMAMGELSSIDQAQMTVQGLLAKSGHKNIASAKGSKKFEALAEAQGVSDEDVRLFALQQESINVQKAQLKASINDQDTQEKLAQAGFKLTDDAEKNKKMIDDANWGRIVDTMDKTQKEEMEGVKETIDYAKQTADFQQSIGDKLQVLTEWFMNVFYNLMINIWDTILSFTPWGDDFKETQVAAAKTQNKDIMEMFDKGAGKDQDVYAGRTAVVEGMKPQIAAAIAAAQAEKAKLMGDQATARPEQQDAIEARIKELLSVTNALKTTALYTDDAQRDVENIGGLLEMIKGAGLGGGGGSAAKKKAEVDAKAAAKEQAKPAATGSGGGKQQTEAVAAAGKAQEAAVETTTGAVEDQTKILKKNTDPNTVERTMNKATLDSMRQALFEFYLLQQSGLTGEQLVQGGMGGADAMQLLGETGAKKKTLAETALTIQKGNASGGVVTSIMGGIAKTSRLPPGEGMAPIGMGEKITPAGGGRGGGGGTQKVVLELKGDLARFVQAKVVNGVADFERNKAKR